MRVLRFRSTGRHVRPVFSFTRFSGLAAALLAVAAPAVVAAAPAHASVQSAATIGSAAAVKGNGLGVDDFYEARQNRPLWFAGPIAGPQVQSLLSLLDTAQADGLDPGRYDAGGLRRMVAAASQGGKPKDIRKADVALSDAFVAYVRDLRRPGEHIHDGIGRYDAVQGPFL